VACFGRAKALGRLLDLPQLTSLWISGVSETAAEVVGRLTSLRSLVLFAWRPASCERISTLADLRSLAICQSPRLRSLDGVEQLRALESLILFDNCNYTRIDPLAALSRLHTLCLEGGFSKRLRLETLEPLARLRRLRRLRLASIRVRDGSLRPLCGLTALREVFIADAFSKEEFTAVATALPSVRGEFLDSRGRPA